MSYSLVHAQSNDDSKPSWSEKMPERQDAPDLDIENDIDTTIELDLGDFNMDRGDVDEDDSEPSDLRKLEEEKKAIEEKIARQKRLAAAKAEEERLQEQQRIAEEKKRAEQLAEEQRIADKLAQDKKLADEKLAEEALANQQETDNNTENTPDPAETEITSTAIDTTVPETETKTEIDTTPIETDTITANAYSWKKIKNVLPEYPPQAARNDREGWVEVEIEIDTNGVVVEANVTQTSRNYKVFNKAALKAVKKWRYEPPANVGITANQTRTVRLVFRL